MSNRQDQDTQAPRLEVRGLSTSFATDAGRIQSVADVSFLIHPGQTLALVGESGSGKSVTSLSLMGLHAKTSQAQVQARSPHRSKGESARAVPRRCPGLFLEFQNFRIHDFG